MAVGALARGQRCAIANAPYRLVRPVAGDQWILEHEVDGTVLTMAVQKIVSDWAKGQFVFGDCMASPARQAGPEVDDAMRAVSETLFKQQYGEDIWKRAQARLVYVDALELLPKSKDVMTPIIQEIWADEARWKHYENFESAPHFTTVISWINRYTASDRDIRSLADKHHDRGRRPEVFDEDVEGIISDTIDLTYLTLERPTVQAVLDEIRGKIARANVGRLPSERFKGPGYRQLWNRIIQIPAYDRHRARFGKMAADIKFRTAGSGAPSKFPLERVDIDHCRLDLFVVDEVHGLPLGRPWLTLVLDERTRYILGYYIGFEEPSAMSMGLGIRHAILPKYEELEASREDVKQSWDAWGIFRLLVTDLGNEFLGTQIDRSFMRLGGKIQNCPRRRPWYKGRIERFFRTFQSSLFSGIPGKTFSSICDKADYDPSKHAVITLATLKRIVLMWIVDVYHHTPHRALGTTPAKCWAELIVGVDRWLPPNVSDLKATFSRSQKRSLTHKGIELDSVFYNGPAAAAVRERWGSVLEVEVLSTDSDLGSIYIVTPETGDLVELAALDQQYAAGLTRWQHKICRQYRLKLLEQGADCLSLYEARERIRALIDEDMHLNRRRSRKRQARFSSDANGRTKSRTMGSSSSVKGSVVSPEKPTQAAAQSGEAPLQSPLRASSTTETNAGAEAKTAVRGEVLTSAESTEKKAQSTSGSKSAQPLPEGAGLAVSQPMVVVETVRIQRGRAA